MTYVLDSTLLIDHLRRRDDATAAFGRALASGRRVTSSVLSRVELWRGSRPHQVADLAALDALVEWIPVDREIAGLAARHAEAFGRSHSTIGAVDYVIAATAGRLDAQLWTMNVLHFPMFPDLAPPY